MVAPPPFNFPSFLKQVRGKGVMEDLPVNNLNATLSKLRRHCNPSNPTTAPLRDSSLFIRTHKKGYSSLEQMFAHR